MRRFELLRAAEKCRNKVAGAVARAVRDGLLARPKRCARCRRKGLVVLHHPSYDAGRWLEVIPLCASCHGLVHAGALEHEGYRRPVPVAEMLLSLSLTDEVSR